MSNKINIWNLNRADDPVHEVTIGSNDGEEFHFKLKRLGTIGQTAAHDIATSLAAIYCESETNPEPEALPAIAGRVVKVTPSSLLSAALLEVAQVGEDKYSTLELVAMAVAREEVYSQLNREAIKLGIFAGTKPNPTTGRESSQATSE